MKTAESGSTLVSIHDTRLAAILDGCRHQVAARVIALP